MCKSIIKDAIVWRMFKSNNPWSYTTELMIGDRI